jgi:TIR domain/SIR2-like domain
MVLTDAGNERFWDNLLQLIEEHRVVPVLGPDLSVVHLADGSMCSLYEVLAERVAVRLEVSEDKLPAGAELNAIASRHLEGGGDMEDVYISLKAVMPVPGELEVPEALVKLAAIRPFGLFVTTTFDDLLVTALNRVRFEGRAKTRVFAYARDSMGDLPEDWDSVSTPVVFHLFGKVSSLPDYVVTQEDTLEFVHALQSERTRAKRLVNELCRNNLLILGCSFPDWLARFFIRLVKAERLLLASGKTDFVADSRVLGDPDLKLFLERFSRRTQIMSMDSANFINELHRRWFDRYPDAGPAVDAGAELDDTLPRIEPGAVFLSYASEDLNAARRIKDCLEAEGIDVFFDKQALESGDDYELKIARYIQRGSAFIPIVSSSTLTRKRRFFRIEWNAALEEEKRKSWEENFILPVSIDGTKSSEDALPPRFGELHWTQLPDGACTSDFVSKVKALYRSYQKASVSEV